MHITSKVKEYGPGQCTSAKSYQGNASDPNSMQVHAHVQTVIPHNVAFQTEDLDTYDSDCDDLSNAQAVLMANISNYGSDVISEVPNSETHLNDMDNQSVHALHNFEQSSVMDFTDNEISSDSNIIPYSQYLRETQQATVQDTNLQAQQDSMILSVIEQMSEQMINHVNNWEKANKEQNNESITVKLERYKEMVKTFEQRLNIDLSSREKIIDSQMDDMIKEKLVLKEKLALKEKIDSLEQNLSKQINEKKSLLQKFNAFKNESKEKENKNQENKYDLEKKIKELDNIVYKVGQSTQTVHMLTKPQTFYDNIHKQAIGYQNPFYLKKAQRMKPTLYDGCVISAKHDAMPVIDDEETLTLEEESRSKMSKKAKDPDNVKQNISQNEMINRLTEDFGKRFTPQQELSTEQAFWLCISNPSIKSSYSPPVRVEVPSELPKLTVMNSMSLNNDSVNMEMQKYERCEMCLNLNAELSKTKHAYNDLLKNHSQLEKHCISLEVSMQLKQEVFQNDESCVNQQAVEIPEYFEINDLKAQLQDKDTTICKLKDSIKSLRKNSKKENVNHDKCDLEPINEELENSVAKLLLKNERLCNEINHVKQVFKDQFNLIKQTRVQHKEHSNSLVNKLNLKSMENEDLKAQIQDKVFFITSLRNDLRKLKGKEVVENALHQPSATTISPGMFKLDLVPLPSSELDSACKYTIRIQELLVYVRDTCPNVITPSAKKVAVKPMNNVKRVRFTEPLTSSNNIKKVESSNTSDSSTPVLPSTGVNCSTSNCGSKLPGNKKNDRISQTPSRNKKNKVEAQPRKVNKVNHVVKPVCNVDVKHSLSNANSKILCATCNKSMFSKLYLYLDSDVRKHMTGNHSQLMNFVSKFWGTVRFWETTQIAKDHGDMVSSAGNVINSRVTTSVFYPKRQRLRASYGIVDLSHLNFGTLNKLAKDGLARGIPRLKFQKDHLFLKTKDEAPAAIIKCIKNIQVHLKATIRNVQTDNRTEFVNQTLCEWRNQTLVEATRTMLIFSKAQLFLWAEAINTACYTQNRSLIRHQYNKTPYELMQDRKPDLSFFHVFGSLCYPMNDHDDLGKFDAKADIRIFVGYAPAKKAFRIYNRRTQILLK
ncbi:retrovirus-related pol polyprotein from transposon TNT 1-94 [Tanacetum coccineum]